MASATVVPSGAEAGHGSALCLDCAALYKYGVHTVGRELVAIKDDAAVLVEGHLTDALVVYTVGEVIELCARHVAAEEFSRVLFAV